MKWKDKEEANENSSRKVEHDLLPSSTSRHKIRVCMIIWFRVLPKNGASTFPKIMKSNDHEKIEVNNHLNIWQLFCLMALPARSTESLYGSQQHSVYVEKYEMFQVSYDTFLQNSFILCTQNKALILWEMDSVIWYYKNLHLKCMTRCDYWETWGMNLKLSGLTIF